MRPCENCGDAWIYASVGDWGSGYESYGYRVNCRCGRAWKMVSWQKTKEDAKIAWNEMVEKETKE